MKWLILPNQLFDHKYLDKKFEYTIYEHPHYFTAYNYNKKKIILHKASMTYYYKYLKDHGFKVAYVNINETLKINNYKLFDPIDNIKLHGVYEIVDNPCFLLTNGLCEKYHNKTDKFFFNAFYMWSKKELNIIPNIASQDKENRVGTVPSNVNIPKIPSNRDDDEFIKIGVTFCNKYFSNNCGNTTTPFMFPVTHKTAKKWLNNFIKYRFKKFGPYEDAILKDNDHLFHSVLSSSINIGLLTPQDVIKTISKYKSHIPINSYEGFVRQLFWREYQRYCYKYFDFKGNYFGNTKKLTIKWYTGDIGVKPVDDCIKKAFDTGYLHHIERLMIIGNFMNISGISPQEGYRWFMEFSCDSYDWVMKQNVLEMVFHCSGGKTMRRPYVSSSNYILKMSNYKKEEWCDKWDNLYHEFVKRNKRKLYKYRYFFRV